MTRTEFEHLPNELIIKILKYLTAVDAWYAFYNLNTRLDGLVQASSIDFDLSCCRKSQFDFTRKHIFKKIEVPFAVKFCPRLMIEQTEQLFFETKSKNVLQLLQSLTLINLTDDTIDIVRKKLSDFINLRSLTIMHDSEESKGKFVTKIMNVNLPLLTYLKLGYTGRRSGLVFDERELYKCRFNVPNVQEFILRIPITFNILYRFLSMLPQIVSIDVIVSARKGEEYMNKPNDFSPRINLQKLVITMNGIVPFTTMARFLRSLPQLHTFWFSAFICNYTAGAEYQDGAIWEELIRTHLPNLTDFRLNVGLEAAETATPSSVMQSFRSNFWTEEKKWWFVADRPENDVDTIELYSLPPPTDDKIIFRPNVPWVSNSALPNFDSIRTLEILPISEHRRSAPGSPRQYTNATTIRSATVYTYNHSYDTSILSNYVNFAKATTCTVDSPRFFATLPMMTNITSLEIRCYDGDVDCLRSLSSPLRTIKRLTLSESLNCYFCNLCDVDLFTRLFPNLEYISIRIAEFACLPILMNSLCHLVYAVILNDPEAIDIGDLKKWLYKSETGMQYKWALENTRLDIWID
ncbi:unnamed protein product [Adineta ricciae]|uniref:F-box domain-containing protein n=1 Tax=Adineta ricciae TaxID=249248 RepID=A0A815A4I5_ADIRI|nr:unnamed protein product [Adineta ricciae]